MACTRLVVIARPDGGRLRVQLAHTDTPAAKGGAAIRAEHAKQARPARPGPARAPRGGARKLALCIGTSYAGTPHELPGCDDDAHRVAHALRHHRGYGEVRKLLNARATKGAVKAAMRAAMAHSARYDEICIFFSGHGLQVDERVRGSEADGKDESILCADGIVRDDDIRAIVTLCAPTCRLVCIFDCCTSGSIADAPTYGTPEFRRGGRASIIVVGAARDGTSAAQVGGEGLLASYVARTMGQGVSVDAIAGKRLPPSWQTTVVSGWACAPGEELFL